MKKQENFSEEIKQEDKKHFGKYIIFMVVYLLVGGVCGYFGAYFRDVVIEGNVDVWRNLGDIQLAAVPVFQYVFLIFVPVYLILCYVYYAKCKKQMLALNRESEEEIERFEARLSRAMIIVSLGNTISTLLYGIALYCLPRTMDEPDAPIITKVVLILVFILGMSIGNAYFINKLVNMEKEINPEKAGSTFDLKFQKKWIESCDEAERLMIYNVCYNVFRKMQVIYSVTATVLCLIGVLFEIGYMPFIAVTLLYLVQEIIYFAESYKMEKGRINEPFVDLF